MLRKLFPVLILLFIQVELTQSQTQESIDVQAYRAVYLLDTLIQSNPALALEKFEDISLQYESFSDSMKTYFLTQRGWNHFRLGNYDNALADFRKAIPISGRVDNYAMDVLNLQLGHLYEAMDSLELAIAHYHKAAKWSLSFGDSSGLISEYDGLAQVFQESGQLDSAKFYFEQSLSLINQVRDSASLISTKSNYATLLYDLGEIDQAIALQEEAKAYEESVNDSVSLIFSNANLGRYYYATNKELSAKYIETSFEIARNLNAKRYLLELSEGFAFIEEEHGNFEKALEYYKSFHQYENELVNEEMLDRVKDWQITLDNQQKDEEIRLQKSRTRNLVITMVIVIALASWIIYSNVQIRKVKAQLEKQNKELDELNATKDKFFSIIAHDLRSPMIALQGVGQKMEYYIRKEKQQKLLEMGGKIDESIHHLNHLLNNLLNWAVSQTGDIPYHPENISLKAITEENLALFKSLADSKQIELVNHVENVTAYVDMNTISTVIRNVTSNALKFSPENAKVYFESTENASEVTLSIKDEGKGMDQSQVEGLFLGGIQSQSGTRSEKGFGLGLRLCQEFTELNRGKIKVESKPGHGTTIFISLPKQAKATLRKMA